MDRRRFVPSPDGLETRTLMATSAGTAAATAAATATASATTTQDLPITFQQKSLRIQNVPKNLRALEPNRFLPRETIEQIQLGLYQIMGRMDRPTSEALTNYNLAMRKIVFDESLSPSRAELLNNGFAGVLRSANAPDPGFTNLTTAMRQLTTQIDTASINPTFLASNDATYILQLANVIGQPMPPPQVPAITPASGKQASAGVSVTTLPHPSFTGTYQYGTTMQMLDTAADNAVVGQATVAKNGQYTIQVTTPLTVNQTYRFRMRAVDEVQHLSQLSREFVVKVVPPRGQAQTATYGQSTPKGPLGVN